MFLVTDQQATNAPETFKYGGRTYKRVIHFGVEPKTDCCATSNRMFALTDHETSKPLADAPPWTNCVIWRPEGDYAFEDLLKPFAWETALDQLAALRGGVKTFELHPNT